jgi:hypothetical protein
MGEWVWAVLAVLAIGVLALGLRRRRRRGESHAGGFHCVAIKPGQPSCEAVRAVGARRFLAAEAPPVPLPDCDLPTCRCRYLHLEDRRQEVRRIGAGGMGRLDSPDWKERRRGHGRRRTDSWHGLDEEAMRLAIAEKRRRRAQGSPKARRK